MSKRERERETERETERERERERRKGGSIDVAPLLNIASKSRSGTVSSPADPARLSSFTFSIVDIIPRASIPPSIGTERRITTARFPRRQRKKRKGRGGEAERGGGAVVAAEGLMRRKNNNARV